MALPFTILSTLLGAGINATAFGGVSLGFSMLRNNDGKEHKRHDLAMKQPQRACNKWNEDRMGQLHFINKRLHEKNEAKTYINNADDAVLEYY